MRVITGKARGRKLREPKGMDIRPTTDMVKEAVFNILQFELEGARVLDLFAGTGQLGIEALSRGAAEAVFVDGSSTAIRIVKENLELCGFKAKVLQGDAIGYLPALGKFDIVFLDPPYDSDLLEQALKVIENVDLLSGGGIIVCESRSQAVLPAPGENYSVELERRYGKVKITVIRRKLDT